MQETLLKNGDFSGLGLVVGRFIGKIEGFHPLGNLQDSLNVLVDPNQTWKWKKVVEWTFAATSRDLSLKGGWGRECPLFALFQGNLG